MHTFLELELRLAREKLLAYENNVNLSYRQEYIQQLNHVIDYLEDRIDDFKREHAL
jgi:hypothetical protein